MELVCQVQHYEWGSRDPGCNVYTLAMQNDDSKSVQISDGKLQKPHAEYWVGTHVNGPSVIKHSGQLLSGS
jgi:mannose-6-phosphate isomerase class I